ncbi:hypothetical protein DITRI_Ditri07aG0058200 [Diplodiscus trichospermus]
MEDFNSCNPESSIARYTKGTDFNTLESSGEFCFLCGFPGHCQASQKLHVTINSGGSTLSPPSPVLVPPPPPTNTVAPSLYTSKLSYMALTVAILASFADLLV